MNPNFTRSVADRNAVRNEYIKNLQLETANNLLNYNSNQIFKQTGQLPPSITAMVDTRSITEKYADQQKAKVAVIAGLREITDGANANEIASQINGRDMIALLNNLPAIVAEIKPKWQLGITAPAFIAYWKKYQKAHNYNSGVSMYPIYRSNQLLSNIHGLLQNIRATFPQQEDYNELRTALGILPRTQSSARAEEAVRQAGSLSQNIISRAEELERRDPEDNPIQLAEDIQQLDEVVRVFPPLSSLRSLGDIVSVEEAMNVNAEGAEQLQQEALSLAVPAIDAYFSSPLSAGGGGRRQQTEQSPSSARTAQAVEAEAEPLQAQAQIADPPTYEDFLKIKNFDAQKAIILQRIREGLIDKSRLVGNAEFVPTKEGLYVNGGIIPSKLRAHNAKNTNFFELYREYLENRPQELEPATPEGEKLKPAGGTGVGSRPRIQGRGVNSNRTHAPTTRLTSGGNYRFTPKVDKTKKVEKVPSYMAFGNYLIHQHDLVGGTLKLRHKSGASITDIPTQAIGGQLKKVLLTLTGTGSPSFEDINELSEKDKALLNKVVKKAKIDQRLLVPTPDKTKEEQDYNRLQILSGEIACGNNNPQLVKELKVLLLRLKNGGRIPKRHYHEIMEDLLTIGY